MLSTTDAIVLSLQPHSDKAHLLHAYTRASGRVNYMVYGLGRKHAIGLYMPLSLIRITASYPPNGVPTLREATSLSAKRSVSETVCQYNGLSGGARLYKQTIRLFIAEVLHHVLRHPMTDEAMYDFLEHAICELDTMEEVQNFHVQFLIDFAAKLGFAMETAPALPQTRAQRQKTLQQLCAYFEEHVDTWQNPRSMDVLMEVFD